jgi:hypothetical protein
VDATLLLPLTDRAASFAQPCRLHPAVWSITENADGWARRRGLVTGDPDGSPLGRSRFGRMAARMFPDADEARVTLFTQWLIWLFAFDDARDESPLGGSATAVDTLYSHLFMSLRRGHARPGSGPLEIALTELWQATSPVTSRSWRGRFLSHLEEHRSACGEEAVNRRTGQIPSPDRYPALRRRTSGTFMFDLVEAVLGVELAAGVILSPAWQNLLQGTTDLIAWCNDVASYTREESCGGTHNYVAVFAHAFDLTPEQTGTWVVDRIIERASEVQAAARQLPATFARLGLDPASARQTGEITEVFLAAPRAHLEWLLESGRYHAHDEFVPRQSSPAPGAALPALPDVSDGRRLQAP